MTPGYHHIKTTCGTKTTRGNKATRGSNSGTSKTTCGRRHRPTPPTRTGTDTERRASKTTCGR